MEAERGKEPDEPEGGLVPKEGRWRQRGCSGASGLWEALMATKDYQDNSWCAGPSPAQGAFPHFLLPGDLILAEEVMVLRARGLAPGGRSHRASVATQNHVTATRVGSELGGGH